MNEEKIISTAQNCLTSAGEVNYKLAAKDHSL